MAKIKSIKYIGKKIQKCIHIDKEDGLYITDNHIVTHNSKLATMNGLNFKIVCSNADIIGQNIICGVLTELAFFIDNGWTDQQIKYFFTKLRDRIDSRMKGNYMGRFILDSSPNTMESVIDQWIWEDAPKDKSIYLFTGPRWKFFNADYDQNAFDSQGRCKPDWKLNFPMYKGGNGVPPHAIDSMAEYENTVDTDIIWCPRNGEGISMYDKAKMDPIEFMKDWAGYPAGQADRIFYDPKMIKNCFDNSLRNVYASIRASADEEPEHLIWDQIKEKFFNKVLDKYYFYYNPDVPRVLSIDQSLSGDLTAVAMSHVERDPLKKDPITGESLIDIITDFTINIIPAGGYINLDAIRYFVTDLIEIGNINIRHVGFDQFQSASTQQYLRRKGVVVDYISVDKTNDAYLTYIDYVKKGRWHCGKCIYTENNMKSIQMQKRKTSNTIKIDHTKGELVQDDSEFSGINAKDALDAVASNCELLTKFFYEFPPTVIWDPSLSDKKDYASALNKTNRFMNKMGFSL